MSCYDEEANSIEIPTTNCKLRFEISIFAVESIKNVTVALTIYNKNEERIVDVNTLIKGHSLSLERNKTARVIFHLNNVRLRPDLYSVGLWMGIINNCDIDGVRYATTFNFEPVREEILYTQPFPGYYNCDFYDEIILSR